MAEFLVHINPADSNEVKKILRELRESGITPKGSTIYVGADSNVAVTRSPTVRVEQVFSDPGSGDTSTVRITNEH